MIIKRLKLFFDSNLRRTYLHILKKRGSLKFFFYWFTDPSPFPWVIENSQNGHFCAKEKKESIGIIAERFLKMETTKKNVGRKKLQKSPSHNNIINTKLFFRMCYRKWNRLPQLPVCTRERYIVFIEWVYTPGTFYIKSAVPRPPCGCQR